MQQYIEAAKIITTHGVRGEVKLEMHCELSLLRQAKSLYAGKNGGRAFGLLSVRGTDAYAVAKLQGIDDMDAARALTGTVLFFDRAEVKLPAGSCYIADLIGCEVRDADTGAVYGRVTEITRPGPQDIYTVVTPEGKEYMFPGVPAFLKARCPEEGYILVTPIPGLLDDDVISEREEF